MKFVVLVPLAWLPLFLIGEAIGDYLVTMIAWFVLGLVADVILFILLMPGASSLGFAICLLLIPMLAPFVGCYVRSEREQRQEDLKRSAANTGKRPIGRINIGGERSKNGKKRQLSCACLRTNSVVAVKPNYSTSFGRAMAKARSVPWPGRTSCLPIFAITLIYLRTSSPGSTPSCMAGRALGCPAPWVIARPR